MDKRISHADQRAYVRRYTLSGGDSDGVRIIECDTGKIRFLLNESRALDIPQLWHEGKNVSFLSKNGINALPCDFSSRFEGGMLYTCGLDAIGGRDGHELHGTIHTRPALVLSARCGKEGILVEGIIREHALFGKNLVLKRRVTAPAGGESVTVQDTLANRGTKEEEYCLLYHVNLGYPFLAAGTTVKYDAEEVVPRTPFAGAHAADRIRFPEPKDNAEERCFFVRPRTPYAEAESPAGGRFLLSWTGETLPCMVQWVSPASGDFALGLEPATSFLDDKLTLKKIAPGEEVSFAVKITVSRSR